MPMTFEVRIVVSTYCGVTRRETKFCTLPRGSWRRSTRVIIVSMGRPAVLSQRVTAKMARTFICPRSRAVENPLLRKTSSPMNRQFTVHLKRKTLENSKALP